MANQGVRHADRRCGLHRHRHGHQADPGRCRRLRDPRTRRPRRRNVARQHVSRCGVRRSVAAVLVLVREEPELVAGVLAGRRDLRHTSRTWSTQFDLRSRIQFGVEVSGLDFDEDEGVWTVTTRAAQTIPGPHRRAGLRSAARPQAGRTSAVSTPIRATRSTAPAGTTTTTSPASGSRSSAPAPAPCRSCPNWSSRPTFVKVFQRTPGWVLPRLDIPMPAAAQELFAKVPATQELARQALYWGHEVTATAHGVEHSAHVAGRPAGQGAHPGAGQGSVAAPTAHPGLHPGLQANADLQRLLPRAAARQLQAHRLADRDDEPGRHPHQ